MRTRTLIPLAALLLAVATAGCGGCGYNRIVQEEQQVEADWSQVETQLQRRADLIPNLVEVVKGYAGHEKGVIQSISDARAAMMGAHSRSEKIAASNSLDGAIGRLFSIAENYPNLKADANFRRLMKKYHPDLQPKDPRSQEAASKITQIITDSFNQLEKHLESKGQR